MQAGAGERLPCQPSIDASLPPPKLLPCLLYAYVGRSGLLFGIRRPQREANMSGETICLRRPYYIGCLTYCEDDDDDDAVDRSIAKSFATIEKSALEYPTFFLPGRPQTIRPVEDYSHRHGFSLS